MLMHTKIARSLVALVVGLFLLAAPALAFAARDQTATQAVTQSYGTDDMIQKGMIVGLKEGDSNKVVPLQDSKPERMHGVVIAANDAAITLGGSADQRQVYVATFGRYETLVSNQNGVIHSGDYIALSALDGIGMKADKNQEIVLGKAAADFTGNNNVVSTATLKNGSGADVNVSIGRIAVDINIAHNPLQEKALGNLPGFLERASELIAHKPVNAVRVYISLVILLITTIVAGSLLYSGVRNGMVSIGRNPLARQSILRSLLQVVLTSFIIFIIGLFAVYLLLRL